MWIEVEHGFLLDQPYKELFNQQSIKEQDRVCVCGVWLNINYIDAKACCACTLPLTFTLTYPDPPGYSCPPRNSAVPLRQIFLGFRLQICLQESWQSCPPSTVAGLPNVTRAQGHTLFRYHLRDDLVNVKTFCATRIALQETGFLVSWRAIWASHPPLLGALFFGKKPINIHYDYIAPLSTFPQL